MNRINIYGPIGYLDWDGNGTTLLAVVEALAGMDGDVEVHINSAGGYATEGAGIHNALKTYGRGAITVVIGGVAASAASLIAMAGNTIVMAEGALMMIHDPATITWGTEEDHRHAADTLATMAQTYAAVYARRSGKSVAAVREIMRAETWYGPDDAVREGFADRAMGTEDAPPAEPTAFEWRLFARAPAHLQARSRTGAGLPRHPETARMADRNRPDGAPVRHTPEVTMTVKTEKTPGGDPSETNPATMAAEATRMERQRIGEIRAMCNKLKLDTAFETKLIDDGVTVEMAARLAIDQATAADPQDGKPQINAAPARVTADATERFAEGVRKALMAKVGLAGGERNEFSSMRLGEMARASLEIRGVRKPWRDQMEMLGQVFQPTMLGGMHSTSDFANILSNVANKSMLVGWNEQEETFQLWTKKGTASDFKTQTRTGAGLFPNLAKIEPGAEYTYGTMSDRAGTFAIATYGNLFAINRQTVVNDDLGMLGDVPRKMGRAAKRTIGNLVYAVLTSNPTMRDSVALFHSSHGNLAGSGAAPSTTSFEAARTAMALQKDEESIATALNLRPAYILVPYAQSAKSQVVITSETEIGQDNSKKPNTARGMGEVIAEGRLDASSSTAWYMAASPNAIDTVEVVYLDGIEEPYLDQQNGWKIDGTEFKVRIDAGVAVNDWKGLYKNPGA